MTDTCLVKLDLFEGPLDLLLHLIKKNEVNIYDIPIELGHTFEQEVRRLVVHGILHLLGYDHKKLQEARLMEEKEKEILEFL